MLDLGLFKEILEIDSTSGKERKLAEFLSHRLTDYAAASSKGKSICRVEQHEVGDGTLNLLFSWGKPKVYFCTHMDTVPPYIPPVFTEEKVSGRGSNDAKGQLFSMFSACLELASRGYEDFGLLLLSGEETGSYGAKAYTRDCPGGELVIVGEPTDNKMVTASKGTKSFQIHIDGKSCHSGYPEMGASAVERFVDFMNELRSLSFPVDPVTGPTTWNVGKLSSDNPQNILSPALDFRLYFRTTAASDASVQEKIQAMANDFVHIEALGGDTPMTYHTFEGIPQCVVAFGSDAPRLEKFPLRSLCGPGSILTAHTADEFVRISDLETAVQQYVAMATYYLGQPSLAED